MLGCSAIFRGLTRWLTAFSPAEAKAGGGGVQPWEPTVGAANLRVPNKEQVKMCEILRPRFRGLGEVRSCVFVFYVIWCDF